jgi:hypothetical protein
VLKRLPVHVENLGCASDVSLRVFEASRDVTALELASILAEIGCKRHPQAVGFVF